MSNERDDRLSHDGGEPIAPGGQGAQRGQESAAETRSGDHPVARQRPIDPERRLSPEEGVRVESPVQEGQQVGAAPPASPAAAASVSSSSGGRPGFFSGHRPGSAHPHAPRGRSAAEGGGGTPPPGGGDNVRDMPQMPVTGPNYRNLLIAVGLLVAVLGVALFLAPLGRRNAAPDRTAPDPPDRTFLDLPVGQLPRPAPPKPNRPWWQVEEEPVEVARVEEAQSPWTGTAGPAPAEEEPGPREKDLRRALKSFELREAGAAGAAEGASGPQRDLDRLLEAAERWAPAALARAEDALGAGSPSSGELAGEAPHGLDPGNVWDSGLTPGGAGVAGAGGIASQGTPGGRAQSRLGSGLPAVSLRGGTPDGSAATASGHAPPLRARRYPPPTSLTLRAGTLIPARLETGIDSDAPGPVTARVVRDVTDSLTGTRVLIPAGAQLLGVASNQLAYGQNRALLAFERITFPGATYELPALTAIEPTGGGGLDGRVSRHVLATLGRAALLGAVGAGLQLSQPDRGGDRALSSSEIVAAEVGLAFNRVATQLLSQGLQRRPTVRIRPGERFYVYVNRDLTF